MSEQSSSIRFSSSACPTLGVEIEVALVDAETMELRSAILDVLERVPEEMKPYVKPELMQSYLEVNTQVCSNVADAEADLREKFRIVDEIARGLNLRLFWGGTHPFSSWRAQEVTPNERYQNLVNLLQNTARQLVTFGLHVHVGVDSGDKAVMICDRILRHLPVLLAASANSPFWNGRNTGLHSWRSKIMEGLPTAGLPPLMRNWSEYVWLINHLIQTGFIETIREIWWDVRPHHNFGTVEVRICDVPGSLDDALALVALIQCLIHDLSREIDHGTYQHDTHPMMTRQNKWRAARYGLEAPLIDSMTFEMAPANEILLRMADRLMPAARDLDCEPYLRRLQKMAFRPTWAQRQVDLYNETGDLAEVVRHMCDNFGAAQTPADSAA